MFGGGRQVSVDSVAYNLAGAEENRANYLKSLVVGHVLMNGKGTMGEAIRNGYLNGPSLKMKQFYRWARKPENYGTIGMPTGAIKRSNPVSPSLVQTAFARLNGYSPWVQRAELGSADYGMWVEQWILDNQPGLIGTDWEADYVDGLITVTGAGSSWSFAPVNYAQEGTYVYAWFNEISAGVIGPPTTGEWVDIGGAPFPDMSGWVLEAQGDTITTRTLIYSRMTYIGSAPTGASYLKETRTLREEKGPPVNRFYRDMSQTYEGLVHGQARMFIYRLGAGDPDLDALVLPDDNIGEFFPFIPVRLNNQFLSESYQPAVFEQARKAYKKATGSKFAELVEKIEDNDSIADIDHAYVTFGVSLNVMDNAARRYVYRFLERLQQSQVGGPAIYASWKAAMTAQISVFNTWMAWKTAQSNSESGAFGTAEPPRPELPQMPGNEIRITNGNIGLATHYDMRLSWFFITDGIGAGLGKPEAKRGDVWFEIKAPDPLIEQVYGGNGLANATVGASVDVVRIYLQESETSFRYMDLYGLAHINLVYGTKGVRIDASTALVDTEESGFIVPLHYDIWREVSLVQGTQMVTASIFVVFNCYKVKKAKWYEKGVFQIVIVIVIAIASVLFTGGAGIGLLGAHMAVGAALGLTGIVAAIVGSIINALAAMILSTILSQFGTAIFGEQFGAIFAAIVMFAFGGGVNFDTGSFAINWGDIVSAENLMKITNVLGQGYAGKINAETAKIAKASADYQENAKIEAEKIQQAFLDEFGYGAGKIDPMMFVDVASSSRILAESSDTFLTRTLLTGSDIAELSKDLLTNFVEYSNKLPDAYV